MVKLISVALVAAFLSVCFQGYAAEYGDEGEDSNLVLGEEEEEEEEDSSTRASLDVERDAPEIIRSRGFEVEEHSVHTKDGYILTVHRVVNPLMEEAERASLKPVLMMHGIFTSSFDWLINSDHVRPARPTGSGAQPNRTAAQTTQQEAPDEEAEVGVEEQREPNSLAFYLANRGYDVWLGNMRGNAYANRHEQYNEWNPSFWNFTLDQLIEFDLPDTISLVQRVTGRRKMAYVGYSQGSTLALGLLSERPEYSEILEPVVALAPVAFVDHMESPIANLVKVIDTPDQVNWWYKPGEDAAGKLATKACRLKVVKKLICLNAFFLIVGFNEAGLNSDRVDAMLSHLPQPSSVKIVAHWAQIAKTGRFQHFDYGPEVNAQLYGSQRPRVYPLGNIRSKLHLFVSDNDLIASPRNVQELLEALNVEPEVVNMSELVAPWNHADYLFHRRAGALLHSQIELVLSGEA